MRTEKEELESRLAVLGRVADNRLDHINELKAEVEELTKYVECNYIHGQNNEFLCSKCGYHKGVMNEA